MTHSLAQRTYPAGYIEPSEAFKLERLNRREENNADQVTSEVVRSWIENGRRIAKEEAERLKSKAKFPSYLGIRQAP